MKELERTVESVFPFKKWGAVRTLVAVSGGADSVALVRALVALGQFSGSWHASNLIVGHVNHGLRGTESDVDSSFVGRLADELGLQIVSSDGTHSKPPGRSEESLRDFRYGQLLDSAQRLGARYIVTGHNFDDQVETILFRIFRGTGISGLAGIPRHRLASGSVTIVRPLLDVSRERILKYLVEIGQGFRVDSSNADSNYTRNYLRNELLPELKLRFGDAVAESIARLGAQASEVNDYFDHETGEFADAVVEQTEAQFKLRCGQLREYSPTLIRHWLNRIWIQQNWPRQSMTFQWWQKICDTIQQDSDIVLNLPCSIRFEKTGSTAVFSDLRRRRDGADSD